MERAEYARMADLEDTMWWYRALHDRLLDQLRRSGLVARARVLDAGCGTGGLLRRLTRDAPGFEYTGVERDPEAVNFAARKSTADVRRGDVNSPEFPTNHFDAILSADVLCHAQVDETLAMREFFRCLKPGGNLILNLPAYKWMKSRHDDRVHNVRRYTVRGTIALAEGAGFEVEDAGYWGGLLFPLMLLHRQTPGRGELGSDLRAFPAWQDRVFYAVTGIERSLARHTVRLPFGGSVWAVTVKP